MPPTSAAPFYSLLRDVKRIPNPLHQQPKRQLIPPEPIVVDPGITAADTKTDTTAEGFAPYPPPPSLHAAILPLSTVAEPGGADPGPFYRPPPPSGEIIAIAVSVVFASLLCISALILALSLHKSKKLTTTFKHIFHKHRPATMAGLTPPEGLIIDISARRVQDTVHPDSESGKSDEDEGSIETDETEGPVPPLHVPLSVSSRECLVSTDDVPTSTVFWSRTGAEEVDGCLVTNIASAGSGSEFNSMIANSLTTRASWKVQNRIRQGSDASESTDETARSNMFSISNSTCSSKTSVRKDGSSQEGAELDDDLNTEETAFEVARAQTQSVEIKRGILISWGGELGGASCRRSGGSMLPSVMVTCASSSSSISVDLSEFPLPPDEFVYMVES